jgi:hypothetical protein
MTENKQDEVTVTKTDKLPCGCIREHMSDGTGREIPCVMHSLIRAGQLLANAGQIMLNDKMRAEQQLQQSAINAIMIEEKKRKQRS